MISMLSQSIRWSRKVVHIGVPTYKQKKNPQKAHPTRRRSRRRVRCFTTYMRRPLPGTVAFRTIWARWNISSDRPNLFYTLFSWAFCSLFRRYLIMKRGCWKFCALAFPGPLPRNRKKYNRPGSGKWCLQLARLSPFSFRSSISGIHCKSLFLKRNFVGKCTISNLFYNFVVVLK